MMDWFGAGMLVLIFIGSLHLFKLVHRVRESLTLAYRALDILSNSDLEELKKEKQFKSLALALFGNFILILLAASLCLTIPAGVLWGLDWLGWLHTRKVLKLALSLPFILITTSLFLLVWSLTRKNQSSDLKTSLFENRYSRMDRALHSLAFSMVPTQVTLAGLEDRAFSNRIETRSHTESPVFITALPRAGTTLLLDLLFETEEFATHSYRHMPFIMVPLFWELLSRNFRKNVQPRERAHGDGMMVSVDSPEAFEEIIWKTFWKRHYGPAGISPWAGKHPSKEFDCFYRSHIRKIITIAQRKSKTPKRYLSKNNLNIARIPYLKRLFPGSTLLVPIRHPRSHALSLLRQHKNFLAIHEQDPFSCRYMRDIGHFDFGRNLRPVNFARWLEQGPDLNPETPEFWMHYWIQVYRFLFGKRDAIIFFDYDRFCENSREGAACLGEAVHLRDIDRLRQLATRVDLRERPWDADSQIDPELLSSSLELHNTLARLCVNR